MAFTRDELIAALEAARPAPEETPNSITSRELASALGVGVGKARSFIRAAIADGVLEPGMIKRVDMTGRLNSLPGYLLAEGE